MKFSHISDSHLGLVQYGIEEREQDVYDAFNQAIDISIRDHVDFVIFAGDIFHVPNPNGTAIVQLANALKKLKQNSIDSFFVLGEHDISRIRSTPIPYVYHNLEFSRYIGQGKPFFYKNILLAGFDKIRKNETRFFEDKFLDIDKIAKNHSGHKILVMHQGITEFNKFAGELLSTEIPKNFTYYAMGHLHDHAVRQFNHLGGPIAYPGSIELTTSEGIKDTKKGFFQVDISGQEAKNDWIELDIRPQFSFEIDYEEITKAIDIISQKLQKYVRRPIVEIKIHGKEIQSDYVQKHFFQLESLVLRYFWRTIYNQGNNSTIFLDSPGRIDEELFRLSTNSLGSKQLATFAIKELLPVLSKNNLKEAIEVISENFEKFKKEVQN